MATDLHKTFLFAPEHIDAGSQSPETARPTPSSAFGICADQAPARVRGPALHVPPDGRILEIEKGPTRRPAPVELRITASCPSSRRAFLRAAAASVRAAAVSLPGAAAVVAAEAAESQRAVAVAVAARPAAVVVAAAGSAQGDPGAAVAAPAVAVAVAA